MAGIADFTLEQVGIEMPHSVQAEQSVLGAVLLDPASFSLLAGRLSADMFYVRQNRAIFTEMEMLITNSVPIDIVVLADRLAADAAFADGGAAPYLAEIANTVPSLTNLSVYVDIVREKFIKRQLMHSAQEILQQAGDDIESNLMLESAEQKLYEIRAGRETADVQKLRDAIISVMGYLHRLDGPDRESYLGIATGFSGLDRLLTGLGKGDLIILASRPGMGKTSFSLNISLNVAKRGVPVMIFSLEMSKDQLASRLLSSRAQVESRQFRTGIADAEDWTVLADASEELGSLPIYLDDTSAITIPEMKSKIRQVNQDAIKTGGARVGLVVIDYLQLMSSGRRSENRVQEVSELTRNLKIMAKDLEVPVMVLSQLSRGPDKGRSDHRPQLSDLRDSGSIEQDADVVMFLYREAYYDDGPDVDESSAQCIVAKNRHGETNSVDLVWDGRYTQFISLQPDAER